MKKRYSSILYFLCIFTLLLAGMVFFLEESEAATYNFYFNNTEQGANSTATPSLVVKDPEKGISNATNGSSIQPTVNGTEVTLPEQQAPPAAATSEAEPPIQSTQSYFPRFRFFGGAAATNTEIEPSSYNRGNIFTSSSYTRSRYSFGEKIENRSSDYLASVTFYMTPDFALSWLSGRLNGPELEVYYLKRAHLGLQSAVLVGTFMDKNRPSADANEIYFNSPSAAKDKKYLAHLGLNIAYNFTNHFGLIAAYRAGLGAGRGRNTSTSSLGASLYF